MVLFEKNNLGTRFTFELSDLGVHILTMNENMATRNFPLELTFSAYRMFWNLSSDKNESLALLFKIFTKIWLLSGQAGTEEPDVLVEDRLTGK